MRVVWCLICILLGLEVLHSQTVCVNPNLIPAIREALRAPHESSVDRTGPWELSRPVALKYGLNWKGAIDERLDSSCARYASEQHWNQLFAFHKDSVLADIAVSVSPSFALRTAKRWAADRKSQEHDIAAIKAIQSNPSSTGKAGSSTAEIPQDHSVVALDIPAPPPVLASPVSGEALSSGPNSPGIVKQSNAVSDLKSSYQQPRPATQKVRYVVKNGDSLWKIAKKFPSTSEAELIRINNGKTTIYPGQILWIPQ